MVFLNFVFNMLRRWFSIIILGTKALEALMPIAKSSLAILGLPYLHWLQWYILVISEVTKAL